MGAIKIIRPIFVLACVVMGALWGSVDYLQQDTPFSDVLPWAISGSVLGGLFSILILYSLRFVTQELFEQISPAIGTIAIGLVAGFLLSQYIIPFFPDADETVQIFIQTSVVLVFGFAGISLGLTRASSWETLVEAAGSAKIVQGAPKLVDTSAIIDGRIKDVCETGFVEGTLLVPHFVLEELQRVADSPDGLRRARGRRGLDILKEMQEPGSRINIELIEDDPKDIREVDAKLVRVARKYKSPILTNDLNLNKVAQIEGVDVLNINDLANALKPAVLPDERMNVRIVKEGKEAQQGVGYLDDGTMIVVDGGREHMGQQVEVLVTSVLQTSAGRMIFTKMAKE